MTIELLITIIIAIIGWIWAITQFCYKRKWQKKDLLASRRYDAYSQYMRKCEEINEHMRKNPQTIFSIVQDFSEKLLMNDNIEYINETAIEFNKKMFNYIQQLSTPLSIINQELSSLLIIASKELTEKLNEQKSLIIDFNNEMQNCLNRINVKDGNSFQILNTLGQDNRWRRFISLNDEIITLMRKEIGVE